MSCTRFALVVVLAGLGIATGSPLYVLSLDPKSQQVVVGRPRLLTRAARTQEQ